MQPVKNKLFILLPDGVGLRNFAYTDFYKTGVAQDFEITFWNTTPFDLKALGFDEIKIKGAKPHPFTDILKRARSQADLDQNIKKANDTVYDGYRFPLGYKTFKSALKSMVTRVAEMGYASEKGIENARKNIKRLERKTQYYQQCKATLQKEQPAFVFCTNQRPVTAIAPILAAQDLGIPTATFIFSWDNLPKGTMVIEPDYYFVWSQHMKKELLYYYPYIAENRIFVTGTPQFETHRDTSVLIPRDAFFKKYGLDGSKQYLCFSGDDETTSPNDPHYLSDFADAIRELNQKEANLGIVFRRCPVDFSDRFDQVLEQNKDLIVSIAPEWKKAGESWNTILPTPEDLILQMNTIAHTEMVVNVASSMVFDYVTFGKPCAYINYDVENNQRKGWSVKKIYNFVHFRSMPDQRAVVWLNSKAEIAGKINEALKSKAAVPYAQAWFEKINAHPITNASERILDGIKKSMRT